MRLSGHLLGAQSPGAFAARFWRPAGGRWDWSGRVVFGHCNASSEVLDVASLDDFGPDVSSPGWREVLDGSAQWSVVEGDSLALLRDLPSESVDGVFVDSPYSSGGQFRGDRASLSVTAKYTDGDGPERAEFSGDNRDQRGFAFWCALWLMECLRVARPGAPLLTFIDWRNLPLMCDVVQAGGWVWRGIVPWNKGEGTRPQMGRPRNQCEYAVFSTKGPALDSPEVGVLPGFYQYPVLQRDKHHITGKPTALLADMAGLVVPGGVILDVFAGSGTTGVGALLTGRRTILGELSGHYASMARRRCAAAARGVSDPRKVSQESLGLAL